MVRRGIDGRPARPPGAGDFAEGLEAVQVEDGHPICPGDVQPSAIRIGVDVVEVSFATDLGRLYQFVRSPGGRGPADIPEREHRNGRSQEHEFHSHGVALFR